MVEKGSVNGEAAVKGILCGFYPDFAVSKYQVEVVVGHACHVMLCFVYLVLG